MPKRTPPEQINDCFELYLKYNGTNFPAIEREMRERGWVNFSSQRIRKKVGGAFIGWESEYGWAKSLEIHLAKKGEIALTSAESLLYENEFIRKKVFNEIAANEAKNNKDLIYQHNIYTQNCVEYLAKLDKARDNYSNFSFFLEHLLEASMNISPSLAKELVEAEDALIEWAERKFVSDAESDNTGN